jgi:hypothetical protein
VNKNARHLHRPVSFFYTISSRTGSIQKDQCSADLSAVRTLKEPGKEGISDGLHGTSTCFEDTPLPFLLAQQITGFFNFQ